MTAKKLFAFDLASAVLQPASTVNVCTPDIGQLQLQQ